MHKLNILISAPESFLSSLDELKHYLKFKLITKQKNKTEISAIVGKAIAKKAVENKIKKVVFDRNGYPFHGRVKAFANAARESGLEF